MLLPSVLTKYRTRLSCIPEMKHDFDGYDYSLQLKSGKSKTEVFLKRHATSSPEENQHNSTEVQWSDTINSVSPQFLPPPSAHCQVQHAPEKNTLERKTILLS